MRNNDGGSCVVGCERPALGVVTEGDAVHCSLLVFLLLSRLLERVTAAGAAIGEERRGVCVEVEVEVEVGRSAEGEGEAGGHFVRWNAARGGVGQTVQTEEDGSGRGAAAAGTEVREWPSLRRLHVELPFMIHAIRPAAATIASKPMLDSMIIPHIIRVLFLVIILAQISALLAVQNRSAARVTTTKIHLHPFQPRASIPRREEPSPSASTTGQYLRNVLPLLGLYIRRRCTQHPRKKTTLPRQWPEEKTSSCFTFRNEPSVRNKANRLASHRRHLHKQ